MNVKELQVIDLPKRGMSEERHAEIRAEIRRLKRNKERAARIKQTLYSLCFIVISIILWVTAPIWYDGTDLLGYVFPVLIFLFGVGLMFMDIDDFIKKVNNTEEER